MAEKRLMTAFLICKLDFDAKCGQLRSATRGERRLGCSVGDEDTKGGWVAVAVACAG